LKTAQFHRIAWDYERQYGVGKIHYEPLGVVAFYWEEGFPIKDVNFLNKDEISLYSRQHKKKFGVLLTHGCISERDLEIVTVQEKKGTEEILQPVGRTTEVGKLSIVNNFSSASQGKWNEVEVGMYGIAELNLLIKVAGVGGNAKRYLMSQNRQWLSFDEDTPIVSYHRITSLVGI
jgi:hypothetical protein